MDNFTGDNSQKVYPQVGEVIVKDGVSVKEDPRFDSLWKHLMHEEPGRGAGPEHGLHLLQAPGIRESHWLETE